MRKLPSDMANVSDHVQPATQQGYIMSKMERADFSDSVHRSPWARKLILSLDGGGVRGYSQLLIMQRLMALIEEIESGARAAKDGTYFEQNSSSSEYPWNSDARPRKVPPDRIDLSQESESDYLLLQVQSCLSKDTQSDFKPHHYFDYFAGTSTGGLSAIMLGRMEMSVNNAIKQYDVVGEGVFAKARWPNRHKTMSFWNYIQAKYPSDRMKEALLSVTKSGLKDEFAVWRLTADERKVPFQSDERRSRTMVVATGPSYESPGWVRPYIFRTYDHPSPSPRAPKKTAPRHLNPGRAHRDPIWKVARATSAAPKYFSKIEIDGREYRDGGMKANNPATLAFYEVSQLHQETPSHLLSIGTGKPSGPDSAPRRRAGRFKDWSNLVKDMQTQVTETEETHDKLEQQLQNSQSKVKYCRLNVPELRDVFLDEWKPRRNIPARKNQESKSIGQETKEKIRERTAAYLSDVDVHEEMVDFANELVMVRRARAKTDRWEQFACSVFYDCNVSTCRKSNARTFDTRHGLRKHVVDCHSFECGQRRSARGPYDRACIWDEPRLGGKDGTAHIKYLESLHKQRGQCKFPTREVFERFLDKGRKERAEALTEMQSGGQRISTARTNTATTSNTQDDHALSNTITGRILNGNGSTATPRAPPNGKFLSNSNGHALEEPLLEPGRGLWNRLRRSEIHIKLWEIRPKRASEEGIIARNHI